MAQNGGQGNNGGKFEAPQPHSVKEQLPGIQYCINSPPPWPEAILLGFQHYLLTLGITVLIPSIIVPQMGGGNAEKATVIQSLLFVSGLSTFFQSFLGTRLPIVVVGSYAYLIPVTSIIQSSRYSSYTDPYERFVRTMRGIQGALVAAACFQSAMGFLGLWRNAVRFLSPLSVVPYVTFTGLGLYHLGFPMLAKCVEVGLPGVILMVFISQYLPRYIESKRLIFDRFSILFSVAIAWLFAQLLTSTTVYKYKPENTQISCRTDRAGLISTAPWIYFPYPFQWGSPTFNAGDAFVMMAPALVSLFESTGTFFAAARYGSATPVPPSVISRGAGWLGIGVLLNGVIGSVTGTTASVSAGIDKGWKSQSNSNICWIYDFLLNICYVSSVGLSFLQFCNLNSFKTKFILGFSFFMGLSVPQYFREYFHGGWRSAHHAGLFSDIILVIFMSHTTVAALVALFFDLTLSRENDETRKDIGLNWWERNLLGVRGPDGVLEALPFRAWIYRSDWREKRNAFRDNPTGEEQLFRVEWHTLNLRSPEISETLSTMPSDARNLGTAVSCRNRIYVLGGDCDGDPSCPDKRFNQIHAHNSVFYFDCDGEWKEAPPMLFPRGSPAAVAIGSKIYVFGAVSVITDHFAEVFDTEGLRWETVPAPPVAYGQVLSCPSPPVFLDSSRPRILVHFFSNGSLHAFYPDDGSWECLEPEFGRWPPAAAMVDDVIYFLPTSDWDCWGRSVDSRDFLMAYHVVYKKWMPIKWKTESPLPLASLINLFHLGNGVMCVAFYSDLRDTFTYKKFRVHFDSDSGEINATVGYVSSVGLSFLQFCNLNSFKTKFILGFSFFMGLSVPQYFREYFHGGWRSAHHAGLFSDIILVIFMSHTTVAALVALFFDLTLSRENDETRKDIGLNWWERFSLYKSDVRNDEFYALPFRLNKFFPSI
ncbi:hypothetical protein GQ457_07G042960 [Hibiscus cannabinus]